MKIRTERKALADALTWTAAAISRKPANAALSGIHLTACDGELVLFAYDYETAHTARVDVDVQDDGECLVNGHFLREIVSALKGEVVELVLESSRLEIHSGRSTYRVSTMRAEDFPDAPAFPKVVGRVARDDLAAIVGTVEHAASRGLLRTILTAVNLHGAVGTLAATTTDRYRIARRGTMWSAADPTGETPGTFDANVPVAALNAALKGMSGAVTIGHEGGLLGLADERRRVTLRCLADEFPAVGKFLGQDPDATVEVDAADLAEAVKRAAMASGEHQIVNLDITEGEIAVTADSDTSEGAEFVECDASAERRVTFNGDYLAAALLAAETERVRLGFTGTAERTLPVSVIPIDGGRIDLVVMPRRAS